MKKCGICRARVLQPAGSVEISLYSGTDFDPQDPQPTSVKDLDLCERCFSVLSRRSIASLIRHRIASGSNGR